MKAAAAVVALVALLGVSLLGTVVMGVPMVTDEQIAWYVQATEELKPTKVPWQAVIALDAVRYRQDFSRVTLASARESARLFVACRQKVANYGFDWRLGARGEAIREQIRIAVPSEIAWRVTTSAGRVVARLEDSLGQEVSRKRVEPGAYVLLVYATEVPAVVRVDVHVTAEEKVCFGRSMDEVMADLDFRDEDRHMAMELLNAFEEPGPVVFVPNPASPYVWPVTGAITSGFGYRVSPTTGVWEQHLGVDIAAPGGTPLRVADSGVVVQAGWNGNYGLTVVVQHDGFQTVYGHLSRVDVAVDQRVSKGEVLGAVGNSGRSTGPHLHFEWIVGGKQIDPLGPYR